VITEKRYFTDNEMRQHGMCRCMDCKGLQLVTRGNKTLRACVNFAERWSLVADKWRRCERFVQQPGKGK
jgi:hypothetical protein